MQWLDYRTTDVNNNGRIDLILRGMDDNTINVCSTVHHFNRCLLAVDVNSDAISDVLLLPWASSNITVLFGYGNGTFHHSPISTSTPSFSSVLHDIGDMHEDGRLDWITSSYWGWLWRWDTMPSIMIDVGIWS